jgi:V/A-type H+-transporting ATPase subunit D
MESINPSRMELLIKRAQIALARQGRDLLKEKRNALWQELMKTADVALRGSAELEQIAVAARRALAWAEALDGREAVLSAAFAARRDVSIEVTAANVVGMPVPIIERKQLVRSSVQRGYSLASTSSRIDAAARCFEEELELVIELAAREMRLRRLAEEIRKTTICVNALEVIVLPRLEAQLVYIRRVLDEREREDLFRLKRMRALQGSPQRSSSQTYQRM